MRLLSILARSMDQAMICKPTGLRLHEGANSLRHNAILATGSFRQHLQESQQRLEAGGLMLPLEERYMPFS